MVFEGSTHEVPVRAMSRDGNVRGSSIDEVVAVGVNRIVCTLVELHISSLWLYAV